MGLVISSNKLATLMAGKRWLRRLGIFTLPAKGFIFHEERPLTVDLYDWKGPSYHVLNWGLSTYEPENLQFLKDYFSKNSDGIFLDIGANIGIYSFVLSSTFSNLKIHAFEPEPSTFACLSTTFPALGPSLVHLHQLALSDVMGSALLFSDASNHGGHSLNEVAILSEGNKVAKTIRIPTDTLDNFAKNNSLSKIDVMKIDVQRHEMQVIAGALNTIKEQRPIVLMECFMEDILRPDSELIRPFKTDNYVGLDPISRELIKFTPEDFNRLKKSGREYYDLAFVPKEKVHYFSS